MEPSIPLLRCPSCNAAVPLGDGEMTACPFCRTEVRVPEAHAKLRQLQLENTALRDEAERLFSRLDKPPSLFVGIVARAFDFNMMAFFMVYGIPLLLYSIFAGLALTEIWAHWKHLTSSDDTPMWVMMAGIAGTMVVTVFVPRVFGVYANRRASGRAILVSALAARAPEIEGGPTLCRECGAPLEFKHERVVVCLYCRTENAVRVRSRLLQRSKEVVGMLAQSVKDAAEIDARERQATRRLFFHELFRYVFRTVVLTVLLSGFMMEKEDKTLTTAGAVMGVCGVGAFFVFLFRSLGGKKVDDKRPDANPAPYWITYVAPFAFYALLSFVPRMLGR